METGTSILATDCSVIFLSQYFHVSFVIKHTEAGKVLRVPDGWTIKESLAYVHTSDHYPWHPH